jgi:hypothetical protein
MWVPDTNTVTLDDISNGPANFSWVYVDYNGFTVENRQPGSDFSWGFGFDGSTRFPHYRFPAADGSANQVLKTNGNGTLSWTTMSGSGTANGWQLTSSTYIVNLDSGTGVLTVPGFMNLTYGQGGADTMNFGTGPGGGSVNATAGNSIYVTTNGGSGEWVFGNDGVLALSTSSTILGNNADPNVYIETVNSGTTSTWTFGTNGVLTLPAATPVIQGNGTGTDVTIIATTGTNTSTWVFGADGNLTLPQGSTLGETSSTTVITPPGALMGQSLVIRPTAGQFTISTDHPSGFVVGENITITVSTQFGVGTGSLDYEFTGTTAQQLGHVTTGTLTFTSESAKTVTWTVPAESNMTTFTFSLVNGSGFTQQGGIYVGQLPDITVTLDSTVTEGGHIHLVAGDPSTVDLYLGDDDQYVKIERDHGNVVIGTNTNTNHWTFGTDGMTSLASGIEISNSSGLNFVTWNTGSALILADTGNNASSFIYIPSSSDTSSRVGISNTNTTGGVILVQGSGTNQNSLEVNSGGVYINTIVNNIQTGIWQFGTDGSLTLPGKINNSTKTTTGSGDPVYPTAIDLTKTVNKLADNLGSTYTLADGHEGQIMYLVPQTGATMTGVNVTVNHARIIDNSTSTALVVTDALLAPFNYSATPVPTIGVVTTIFTDGAWQSDAGVWTY